MYFTNDLYIMKYQFVYFREIERELGRLCAREGNTFASIALSFCSIKSRRSHALIVTASRIAVSCSRTPLGYYSALFSPCCSLYCSYIYNDYDSIIYILNSSLARSSYCTFAFHTYYGKADRKGGNVFGGRSLIYPIT